MNSYAIIGLLLFWLASLAGVGVWQNTAGHTAERAAWQAKETSEIKSAAARTLELEVAARATEKRHADALAEISTDYERKIKNAKTQRDRDVAAALSGALGLRLPSSMQAGGSATGSLAAATGGRDGGASGQLPEPPAATLPPDLAAGLLGLADDADQVAQQLAACQAVVISDRR